MVCVCWLCVDVTVKIITLTEDKVQEEGGDGDAVGDRDGDLTNAMSRLLDSLLVSSLDTD